MLLKLDECLNKLIFSEKIALYRQIIELKETLILEFYQGNMVIFQLNSFCSLQVVLMMVMSS